MVYCLRGGKVGKEKILLRLYEEKMLVFEFREDKIIDVFVLLFFGLEGKKVV